MISISDFLELELLSIGDSKILVFDLISAVGIILVTYLVLWIIKKALFRKSRTDEFNQGNAYALFQIIRYVVWLLAFGLLLESIGIKVTVLIAGSAALLVGVGLGLQQTFNDVISGIILLSERSIRIGDILEIDNDIVVIQEIGLRTSKGLNRDDISVIIPNSLITTNKVINWSHQSKKTRFRINVGVAYGSDVDLVFKILEDSVRKHPDISTQDVIEVRLTDFGNSSIDFQVLFFSHHIFRIEKIKSDIRRIINKKFEENNVTIPFPQMDVHFKSGEKSLPNV